MKQKQKWMMPILSLLILICLLLPSGLVFAEDIKVQINFTVDGIQQAGIEDQNFAQAIYDSIKAQPDKFLDGNTLTNNSFATMEELLNAFNGDMNASGKEVESIEGISILKSLKQLDLSNNLITDIRPLSVTNGREHVEVKPEEKLYYGESKRNMKVSLLGNPITTYPSWIGGRITFPDGFSNNPVFFQTLVFISDGTGSFAKNYKVPLNLRRDEERVFLDSSVTNIVNNDGDFVDNPKVSPATLGGQLEQVEIVDINQSADFFLMLASSRESQMNWFTWNGSFVDTAIVDSASFSWFYPLTTEIYSKIEKGSTDTKHSVSLVKLGADDNDVKAGAQYSLYIKKDSGNELIAEKLTTDEKGLVKMDALTAGDYYFVETNAPQGYTLDSTPIEFVIENGSIDILGGSGNKLTPTDGEEQTIDGTFVLSGSDEAPASVVINEPANGVFDTLTLDWTDGNQGGTAGKVVYQLGTGTNTGDTVYVASKEEAEQKALDKLKECRDLYQNVKISASFNQKIELSQVDELAVTVDKAVNKIWEDHDNQDGIRPSQVKVQLYADNKAVGDAVMLNEGNGWSYTWTELARFTEEQEVVYSVKEVDVPDGYTENVEIDKDGNFTLTNTHTPEPEKPVDPDKPTNPEQPTKPEVPTQPTTPNKNTPQTGDATNFGVLIAMLLGSSALLGTVVVIKRRKRNAK